jgi:hypothetical protein
MPEIIATESEAVGRPRRHDCANCLISGVIKSARGAEHFLPTKSFYPKFRWIKGSNILWAGIFSKPINPPPGDDFAVARSFGRHRRRALNRGTLCICGEFTLQPPHLFLKVNDSDQSLIL